MSESASHVSPVLERKGSVPHNAALAAARGVEEAWPARCRQRRVDVVGLARDLDIVVRTRDDLPGRAQWRRVRMPESIVEPRLWHETPVELDVVEIRADLRDSVRRFALAHEIGHVVLYRQLGSRAMALPVERQESFANYFAAEILIPRSHRGEVIAEFRDADDPVTLLRLAGSLGVSPRMLLRFARMHDWLRRINRVWLDVRSLPNRHTNQDRRLRVFDAVLDRERWFVPANRSVRGVLGCDEWLAHAGSRTQRAEARMDISRRSSDPPHRFVHCSVPVRLAGLRLRYRAAPNGMEFLACAELRATS